MTYPKKESQVHFSKINLIISVLLLIFLSIQSFAKKDTPNILFIEADDLMPHFMNKLGDGFGHTPNLDRLATEGVYFPSTVCQGPMCGPSRNGLITGSYSHNLGFFRNGQLRNLPNDAWIFPPVLQEAGYETAYIGKSHIKAKEKNKSLGRDDILKSHGFDYANNTGERYMMWKFLRDGHSIEDYPFVKHLKKRGKYEQFLEDNKGGFEKSTMEEDIDYLDGFSTQVAVDWLEQGRNEEKPFFLWFNFCLPHGPYNVPQRYFDLVGDQKIPAPKTDGFGHEVPAPLLKDNSPVTLEKVTGHRLGEYANVAFMDKMIGRLLNTLEAKGELENTVVVFFSDHSIFLGNHGRIHKGALWEDVLDASLIVRYPKRFGQDMVVMNPVELLDLIPTAFELAGVKKPNKVSPNGRSIVPLLKGKSSNGRKYAFSEILGAQSAFDGRYHYIVSEEYEMLYDHKTDPIEMVNVAESNPKITQQFRKAVQNWMENSGPVYPPKTF